jgi:hypothetical protein
MTPEEIEEEYKRVHNFGRKKRIMAMSVFLEKANLGSTGEKSEKRERGDK